MYHQTVERLHAMRLTAMAERYLAQCQSPEIAALSFEERFAILVDAQHVAIGVMTRVVRSCTIFVNKDGT